MSAQSLPITNGNNGHPAQRRVIVCAGTGCVASGSYKVYQALVEQVRAAGIPVITEFRPEEESGALRLNKSGCQGFCQMGPLVTVLPENLLYNKVRLEDVAEIVSETLVGGPSGRAAALRGPGHQKALPGRRRDPVLPAAATFCAPFVRHD